MKRIFKYPLPVRDLVFLDLPLGAQVLSVAVQEGSIVLYALIDDAEKQTDRQAFRVVGTGHLCEDVLGMRFLGTVNLHNGALMFHIFHDVEEVAA